MKLVVKTSVGDGYTFSCDVVRPVEYESAEAFLVHLEEKAKQVLEAKGLTFEFAGHDGWSLEELGYMADKPGPSRRAPKTQHWVWSWDQVEIMTIDDWFAKYAITATTQYYP